MSSNMHTYNRYAAQLQPRSALSGLHAQLQTFINFPIQMTLCNEILTQLLTLQFTQGIMYMQTVKQKSLEFDFK